MTNEEAIKRIKLMYGRCDYDNECRYYGDCYPECTKAVDMAISALKQQENEEDDGKWQTTKTQQFFMQ